MKYIETKTALKDKQKIKSMSKSIKNRAEELVKSIVQEPRSLDTIGNPEQLKYTDIELWARELNKKDRIVYGIELGYLYSMPDESEVIVIYQYLGHFTDK